MEKVSRRHEKLRLVGKRVDLDLAVRCVELSKLAYRPRSLGEGMAQRAGYQGYVGLSRRQERDFVMLVHDDAYRYVAFRGTDQRLDWVTNLNVLRMRTPYGRVHRGYYQVCRDFLPELKNGLESMPDLPTVYTGHSMGGALAVLTALMLAEQGVRVHSLYTFGQPQVGDRAFSNTVETNIVAPFHRFVHGADAIAVWGMGQRALLGQVCYFDVRGRLQFGHKLSGVPGLTLRLHRLQHYRYYLRLNRLKLRALETDQDETIIPP